MNLTCQPSQTKYDVEKLCWSKWFEIVKINKNSLKNTQKLQNSIKTNSAPLFLVYNLSYKEANKNLFFSNKTRCHQDVTPIQQQIKILNASNECQKIQS